MRGHRVLVWGSQCASTCPQDMCARAFSPRLHAVRYTNLDEERESMMVSARGCRPSRDCRRRKTSRKKRTRRAERNILPTRGKAVRKRDGGRSTGGNEEDGDENEEGWRAGGEGEEDTTATIVCSLSPTRIEDSTVGRLLSQHAVRKRAECVLLEQVNDTPVKLAAGFTLLNRSQIHRKHQNLCPEE